VTVGVGACRAAEDRRHQPPISPANRRQRTTVSPARFI